MKNIKKIILLFAIIPFIFSCMHFREMLPFIALGVGLGLTVYLSGEYDRQYDIDAELENLTKNIVGKINSKYKENDVNTVLAVVSFKNLNTDEESYLGRYVADYTTAYMERYANILVVERIEMTQISKEIERSKAGLISDEKEGELIGADLLLLGTLSQIGDRIKVNARVVNSKTGEILISSTEDIYADSAYEMYYTY